MDDESHFGPVKHANPYNIKPWLFPEAGEMRELLESYDKLKAIVGDRHASFFRHPILWIRWKWRSWRTGF